MLWESIRKKRSMQTACRAEVHGQEDDEEDDEIKVMIMLCNPNTLFTNVHWTRMD
jgi:hypothetical protein